MFNKKHGTGALDDTRTPEEKERDFLFDEIVASAEPVVWIEKPPHTWRRYPLFNQGSSNACVAYSLALVIGAMFQQILGYFIHFSPGYIYNRRTNKDAPGMNAVDAFSIPQRDGIALEEHVPSQNMTDEQMALVKEKQHHIDIARALFQTENYIFDPVRDIEVIASIIQKTDKPVVVWFRFNYGEWGAVPMASLEIPRYHHSVVATDFTLYKSKKSIIIQDSWGPAGYDNTGLRVITEDFHRARNTFSGHVMRLKYGQSTPPKNTFTLTMKVGDRGEEVKKLQEVLRSLGHFPTNVDTTGYYGGVTAKAVFEFQKANGVDDQGTQGRIVGPATRKALNGIITT
jgi:hypothetical protein